MSKSILSALLPMLLLACTQGQPAKSERPVFASVTGRITTLQRMALPPEAIVLVQLQDETVADAPQILAEQRLERPGQVPITFDLRYDSRAINPDRLYTVSVRILRGTRVLFSNEQNAPVLTRGKPARVEMILKMTPQNGN